MSNFTPGPWKIKQGSRWGEYMIYAPQKKAGRQVEQPVAFTVDHNARAIAQVPEMVELIKEFVPVMPIDEEVVQEEYIKLSIRASALLRRIEGEEETDEL